MKKTTIYITDEVMALLDAKARKERRPKAGLIREALAQYLACDEPKLPAWIGMIKDDDGSLTSENVDEWLRENWHAD
jgi:predicted transcriptional regulator